MTAAVEPRSEFKTQWRLLLAATLGTGLGFPTLPFYSIGIFAPMLAKEFGWPFASIFAGLALTPVVLLLAAPFVGALVDRYGARKLAALSLAGLGVSYSSLALSTGSIVQYYASWAAIAVTGAGATSISFTRAINDAFVRHRGIALGIALAGMGLFAMLVKPLGNGLMAAAGWRAAILVIGLLPLALGVPVALWGLPAARSSESRTRDAAAPASAPLAAGLTMNEALRTRAFWLIVIAFLSVSFAIGAPLPNMENILRSLGIDAADLVPLTSLGGGAMIVGRLAGGWLIDRLWAPLVGAVILLGAVWGCRILSGHTVGYHEARIAILLLGFAGGVEVDLLSYLVARYAGMRSYGAVYGTVFGLFAIGAGVGPSVLGYAYDRAGSYAPILGICSALLTMAAVLMLSLGRYPRWGETGG